MDCKIVSEHSEPVAIFVAGSKTKVTSITSDKASLDVQNENPTTGLAELITIRAESESPVVVIMSRCSFVTKEWIQTARPTK